MLPIAQAKSKLQAAQETLDAANEKLNNEKIQLQNALQEIQTKVQEIKDSNTVTLHEAESDHPELKIDLSNIKRVKQEREAEQKIFDAAQQTIDAARQRLENARKKLEDALREIDPQISVTSSEEKDTPELKIDPSKCSSVQVKSFVVLALNDLFNLGISADSSDYKLKYPEGIVDNTLTPRVNAQNQINTYFLDNLPQDFFKNLMGQEMTDNLDSITTMNNDDNNNVSNHAIKYHNFRENLNLPANTQNAQSTFASRKQEIITAINSTYPWRPALFGHHHHGRRKAVCDAINRAISMQQIRFILDNQLNLAENSDNKYPISEQLLSPRFSIEMTNSIDKPSKSGYLRAIKAAKELADTPPSQQQQNHRRIS